MTEPQAARAARRAVVLAFAFNAVFFSGFTTINNPNELSRIEAVVSFVETGTFSIDGVIGRLGNQEDKATADGRLYSNKAPGLILAMIPAYAALRLFFPPPGSGTAAIFMAVRLATVTLASLLALARLGRRLADTREHAETAPLVLFAVAFGTPFLFYARSLFSHAWSASLLFLAWDSLRRAESMGRGRGGDFRYVLCGLLAGWAAISEYTTAPVAVLLAARAGVGGRRAWSFVVLGAFGPLLLLAAYNAVCFGSPFTLSSAREATAQYRTQAERGLFGIGGPSPWTAAMLLFHPARGIWLFSPFLLWGLPGVVRWWRSCRARADCVFVVAAVAALFVPVAGYAHWEGGFSLGVRYLVPALLFAALPLQHALASAWSRGLFLAAAVFSAANHFLIASGYPHVPSTIPWPAANLAAWMIVRGWAAPNLGIVLGLAPAVSLLAPLAAMAIAAAFCLPPLGPVRPRASLAAAGALFVFGATLLVQPSLAPSDAHWRATMIESLLAASAP